MQNPQECGLFTKDQDRVPLKYFSIEGVIKDSIGVVTLNQSYINWNRNPIEVTYSFPMEKEIVVSALKVEIDDKVIEGRVEEKQKAKEHYEDALGKGNAGVLVQEDEEDQQILRMHIGNILPGQQATITVTLILKVEVENGAFTLRIPTHFTPKQYSGKQINQAQSLSQDLSYSVRYFFDLDCSSDITYQWKK